MTELLWWRRKPTAQALLVLMAQKLGPSKLAHRTELQAAMWGRMGDRLSNGAAGTANWGTVHLPRRIRKLAPPVTATAEIGELTARHGSSADVNARY